MSEEVRKRNTGTGQGEAENVSKNFKFSKWYILLVSHQRKKGDFCVQEMYAYIKLLLVRNLSNYSICY